MRKNDCCADQAKVSKPACRLLSILLFFVLPLIIITSFPVGTFIHAREKFIANKVIEVGVTLSPPFVIDEGEDYSGMAIELWESIAKNLDLQFNYSSYPTFKQLVEAAASDQIDVVVTNLTITKNREERVDFTQPWFDAGLRLMVRTEQGVNIRSLVAGLKDGGHLRAYGWALVLVAAATLLLTLYDRKIDPDFPRRWREGIAESFHTVMSVASSGRPEPGRRKEMKGWLGRIWAAVWLMCGITVLSYFTA